MPPRWVQTGMGSMLEGFRFRNQISLRIPFLPFRSGQIARFLKKFTPFQLVPRSELAQLVYFGSSGM